QPEDFGLPRASLDSLKGGTVDKNAALLRSILAGALGPQRDVMLMNAAAVLLAGDMVETLQQGAALASEVIDGGNALAKLEQLVELSQSMA
ncbi:unnamed protein product, partial [marine sediment metagenome]